MAQRTPAKLIGTIDFELMQLRQRTYKGNQICILPHIKGNGRNYRNPFRLQLQRQIAQLGAFAGNARLDSLAHPPWRGNLLQLHFHRREAFLQELPNGHSKLKLHQ